MAPSVPTSLIAHCDGGSRGNPGHAAYGVDILDAENNRVAQLSQYLGITTNNVAEYRGLIAALKFARDCGVSELTVISDSELMVCQVRGLYKVRSEVLRPLYNEVQSLIRTIPTFKIRHVLRSDNREADRLANEAMDRQRRLIRGR